MSRRCVPPARPCDRKSHAARHARCGGASLDRSCASQASRRRFAFRRCRRPSASTSLSSSARSIDWSSSWTAASIGEPANAGRDADAMPGCLRKAIASSAVCRNHEVVTNIDGVCADIAAAAFAFRMTPPEIGFAISTSPQGGGWCRCLVGGKTELVTYTFQPVLDREVECPQRAPLQNSAASSRDAFFLRAKAAGSTSP